MRRSSLAGLVLSIFVLCGLSFADSTFNFNGGGGDFGASCDSLSSGGNSLTVCGYSNQSAPSNLYFKSAGGDEVGLGLVSGGADHEIGGTGFLQFSAGVTSLTIGSVQPGENWKVYGSNNAGTFSTANLVAMGSADGTFPINPGSWKYLDLAYGGTGDILLNTVVVSTPEPTTPALMLVLGVVGLAGVSRRKLVA